VVLPTFVLVSRMQLVQKYRENGHFLNTVSSSRREEMVVVTLSRGSTLSVGLGVGGETVTSGSCAHPSHSCDGCVCDFGVVGVSSIFGLVREVGAFTTVSPTFVLVSRMQLVQQYRVNDHFLIAASSSRHEEMVDDTLTKGSALRVGLGVCGVTVVFGSCVHPSHSWISLLSTSSSSPGTFNLFCRATQCM
jgi:hypothetical protein